MKKGLRRTPLHLFPKRSAVRTLALMKKGLRRCPTLDADRFSQRSNTCPDEEGIKTQPPGSGVGFGSSSSNTCPDEEGIKTHVVRFEVAPQRVRTLALMKKGLRLLAESITNNWPLVRTLALMKKGLRPRRTNAEPRHHTVRTLALMKKGLRHLRRLRRQIYKAFEHLP